MKSLIINNIFKEQMNNIIQKYNMFRELILFNSYKLSVKLELFKLSKYIYFKILKLKINSNDSHNSSTIKSYSDLSSINILKKLDFNYLEDAYKYNLLFHKFKNALDIRNIYFDKLIDMQVNSEKIIIKSLQAALELGKYDFVISECKSKLINKEINFQVNEILSLCFLLSNNYYSCNKIRQNYLFSKDKDYYQILKQKNIALVGPGQLSKKALEEISKFDLIIYLNLLEKNNNNLNNVISYYNCEYNFKFQDKIRNLLPNIIAASFSLQNDLLLHKSIEDKCNLLRQMHLPNNVMLPFAIPNMIQNILYDLTWNPLIIKRIKLFGVSLFLGNNLYRKNYPSYGRDSSNKFFKKYNFNTRRHNPISNFCFLSNFYRSNILECDLIVENILDDRLYVYLSKMDEKF